MRTIIDRRRSAPSLSACADRHGGLPFCLRRARARRRGDPRAPSSYDDMTTYSCRTNALPIVSGQNLNLFAQTKTCPNAAEVVSGEGDTSRLRPRLDGRRATSPASSRAWSRSSERRPRHAERLGPPPPSRRLAQELLSNDGTPGSGPTVAAGEEKTEVKLPQGYGMLIGWRVDLGPQLHDPQPERVERAAGLHHLGDRLGAGRERLRRGRSRSSTIRWLDVAGARADLSRLRRREGLRPGRRRQVHLPRRRPTIRASPATRSTRRSRPSGSGVLPGDRTLVFGAGHLHPGGHERRSRGRPRRRSTPAPWTATIPRRSSNSSNPTPSTTSRPAR